MAGEVTTYSGRTRLAVVGTAAVGLVLALTLATSAGPVGPFDRAWLQAIGLLCALVVPAAVAIVLSPLSRPVVVAVHVALAAMVGIGAAWLVASGLAGQCLAAGLPVPAGKPVVVGLGAGGGVLVALTVAHGRRTWQATVARTAAGGAIGIALALASVVLTLQPDGTCLLRP